MGAVVALLRQARLGSAAMLGGVALALLTALSGLGLLALSGWFVAAAALAGLAGAAFNVMLPSAGVRAFAILRPASRYAERLVTHDGTFRALARLRVWIFRKAIPLAPARFEDFRGGDLLNRLTADVDALDAVYLRLVMPCTVAACMTAAVGGILLWLAPPVGFAVLVLAAVAGLALPLVMSRLGAAAGRETTAATARLRTRIVEGLQGLSELKVYQADVRHAEAVAAENAALTTAQRRMGRLAGLSTALSGATAQLATLATLVLGIGLLDAGALTGPPLVLLLLAVLALFDSIAPLPAAFQLLGRLRAAAARLLDFAATPPAVADPAEPAPLPTRLDFALRSVTLRYRPEDPPALDGVDLDLPEGRRLALVGASGSGKSTVAALLMRFRDPEAGSATLGGVDLRRLTQAALWSRIAYMSQRSQLFAATIRDNLLLADPDADDAALAHAVAAAGLAEWIATLPRGLDTWVGEAGVQVSGGQARRIALARCILKDAPVLVLDEPTEGLDADTERQVIDRLATLMEGRTVLLITHRPALLALADEVALLAEGRVVAVGAPDAVLGATPPRTLGHAVG